MPLGAGPPGAPNLDGCGNGVLLAGLNGESRPASYGLVTPMIPGEKAAAGPLGVAVPLLPLRRGGGKSLAILRTLSWRFRA